MKVCPSCHASFGSEAVYCPHHGVGLVDHPLIGTTVDGRYVVDEKLGEGGMGIVFRAHHTILAKVVAIKVLKREVARDPVTVKRFLQEAKAASRIAHANVVDVMDFGQLPDGSAFFVMEYLEGPTLARMIEEGGRPALERTLAIVAQIGRALGAAHEKGIVHRDLKPENVFLVARDSSTDFVKLVDFGIAKIVEDSPDGRRLTRAGTVFGTPEYMSPEQAAGHADTDHRVDIYALGTILYEMVVGQVPHKGETMVATVTKQLLEPIRPPRETAPDRAISEEMEGVIMKALAKDRDERYGSMSEFLAALETASNGAISRAFGKGMPCDDDWQEHGPPKQKRRWIAASGTLAGIVLAIVLLVLIGKSETTSLPDASPIPDRQAAVMVAPDASMPTPDAMVEPPRKPRLKASLSVSELVTVVAHTIPRDAELYADGAHVGVDAATFHRPRGATLDVRCRLRNYEPGRVHVLFDGARTDVFCVMNELKNPFEPDAG